MNAHHRTAALALLALATGLAMPAATAGPPPQARAAAAPGAADPFEGDPYQSMPWVDMRREYLGGEPAVFDARVSVRGPAFAEDPMNVPITVSVSGLADIERIVVLVDRNPIRRVLEYQPLAALPSVSFRFKLEQASPVRAAVRTRDGLWHVGSTWVDSAGGGCTVSGATRKDGSWSQTLGLVSGKVFTASPSSPAPANATPVPGSARLRLRVMHPMDTGLVGGIPAFYVNKLSVRDAAQRELLRLATYEPVSENPVFSFDFAEQPAGGLRIVGTDNNGNRIDAKLE
jgi:sulfur-oxidizing protein SoxY